MNARKMRIFGAFAASAVVGIGAVVVAIAQPSSSIATSDMQTGVTQTATTPSTAPAVGKAAPIVTGPAALPPAELALPGG